MKKKPVWMRFFFGNSGYPRAYGYGVWNESGSLWGLLCSIIREIISGLPIFSLALVVLKLCGVIHARWLIVALPYIIRVSFAVFQTIVNYIAYEARRKYEEKERAEEIRKFAERERHHNSMIFDEETDLQYRMVCDREEE